MAGNDVGLSWEGPAATGSRKNNGRSSVGGAVVVFFAALLLFTASSLSAKWLFPRGVSSSRSSHSNDGASTRLFVDERVELVPAVSLPKEKQQHDEAEEEKEEDDISPSQHQLAAGFSSEFNQLDDDVAASLEPVHTTTEICTGNHSLAVIRGVDFVAYKSLLPGQLAVYGSKEHSARFNDYLFYFSSEENKLMFESDPVRYVPAWGGFCSYGIAHEVEWNENVLGPNGDPDYWWIKDDVLYLFKSAGVLALFSSYPKRNIEHGWEVWRGWFGDTVLTPFNTACFCDGLCTGDDDDE